MNNEIKFILKNFSRMGIEIVKKEDLINLLSRGIRGYKFRIKIGITPTNYRLHLGHALLFRTAKLLQDYGGVVVVVVADFSARLRGVKIKKDLIEQLWELQIGKIMGRGSLKMLFQSDWARSIKLGGILSSVSRYEADQLKKIPSFSRSIYFLTAAYDSLVVNADVEIVGEDQESFILLSRALQKCHHKNPEVGLVIPNILGVDGRKMGKSQNNCIYLSESPEEVRMKIHLLSNKAISYYFRGLTDYCGRIDLETSSNRSKIREVLFREVEKSIFRC